MLSVAFGIVVLLALSGSTAAKGCSECQPSWGGTEGGRVALRGSVWRGHHQ